MNNDVELSVIIPVSERYDGVRELYREYKDSLESCDFMYEFVYVLDGEFQEVQKELQSLQKEGEPIRIIALAKNFGEATALTAGFESTSSEYILILPAYHQVKPSEISKLVNEMQENDMVIARRWPRTDSLFNRVQTGIFAWLVQLITGSAFQDMGCSARAIKRRIIDEISIYGDQHRFLPILASRLGFRTKEVNVAQSSEESFRRIYGLGVYPRRLLDVLTIFFLVKFTNKPLRFFGLIGSSLFAIGSLFLSYIVFERLFLGIALAERPAMLLSSLLVVLGVQIFALGLIGELIIFTHAKQLKEYTIDEIINEFSDKTEDVASNVDDRVRASSQAR